MRMDGYKLHSRESINQIPVAMAHKDDLYLLFLFRFHLQAGQNTRLALTFLYLCIQSPQGYPLVLVFVKDFRHVLGHANHRQVLTKLGKDCRPAKPTVHEDIVRFDAKEQSSFYHTSRCSVDLAVAANRRL